MFISLSAKQIVNRKMVNAEVLHIFSGRSEFFFKYRSIILHPWVWFAARPRLMEFAMRWLMQAIVCMTAVACWSRMWAKAGKRPFSRLYAYLTHGSSNRPLCGWGGHYHTGGFLLSRFIRVPMPGLIDLGAEISYLLFHSTLLWNKPMTA